MLTPEISVILPVYNGERFLSDALASLDAQTFRRFEVIAIDDGSTDRSGEILEKHAGCDSRVRVIRRSNTGIVGALNEALALAQGEFAARMDADDICMPERFASQITYLRTHLDCVAVGGEVVFTDPTARPLIRSQLAHDHDAILKELLAGNGGALVHPAVMFRRSAVVAVGAYREEFRYVEDLELYLRLISRGRLANLPETVLHYRQHLSSINHRIGVRLELTHRAVAPYRAARSLPALKMDSEPSYPVEHADWCRHWAYDAMRGGFRTSAVANAWQALRLAPADRRNWRCLRYILASLYPGYACQL